MIINGFSSGLPVLSTGTRVLDHLHHFYEQRTARGDFIFVRESLGALVEIAVIPIDDRPFLRWSEVTPAIQPLLDKEFPSWQPMDAQSLPKWRRLDEESWPKEIAALFIKLLDWMTANGMATKSYEDWQAEAAALPPPPPLMAAKAAIDP